MMAAMKVMTRMTGVDGDGDDSNDDDGGDDDDGSANSKGGGNDDDGGDDDDGSDEGNDKNDIASKDHNANRKGGGSGDNGDDDDDDGDDVTNSKGGGNDSDDGDEDNNNDDNTSRDDNANSKVNGDDGDGDDSDDDGNDDGDDDNANSKGGGDDDDGGDGDGNNDLSKDDGDNDVGLHVYDAGCGHGAGLMWFETNPSSKTWDMVGHTISEAQIDFIHNLPAHKFQADLKSYDDLETYIGKNPFDVIYSIEAFIHSTNAYDTLKAWSNALAKDGLIILIDNFLSVGVDKNADDIRLFQKSWKANMLYTSTEILSIAAEYQMELVLDRDLGSEYQIVKNNYGNKLPELISTEKKSHQGWLGAGMRQRLMIEGKLTYR